MRRLYFDLDGTVLELDSGLAKSALTGGRIGTAIREAGIDELVCVGNFVRVCRSVLEFDQDYDGLGAIFGLCRGTFDDESWFRSHTRLASDPTQRVREIEDAVDWWYMDDLAEEYATAAGRTDWYRKHVGRRILVPTPRGSRNDILRWLLEIDRPI